HPPVGVTRVVLCAADEAISLDPCDDISHARERLALAVARVRRRPPPGRLDRPAAVRRDDQVAACLVEPLPELPPRRRAAVAKVEVDGRGDREDLRGLHGPQYCEGVCRRIVAPIRYLNGNGVLGCCSPTARTFASTLARSSSGSRAM